MRRDAGQPKEEAMANLPEKATHQQTRAFNQQLVLRAIYDRSAISRAEVARVTGLTRTSVSSLVADLIRDGLVEEAGRGPSTGGKAPILVQVRAQGRHLIGLDLGESHFTGATVDLRGRIIKSVSVALEGRNGGEAVQAVIGLIEGLVNSNGASPLLGIGIGAPGLIDSRTGMVRWAVNLDWTDLPLGQIVGDRFGVPVVVANDSQAAAVAELTFGPVPRPDNLIVVRVGRGIGAGIILDGQLHQGDGSGAGEIGHSIFGTTSATPRGPERLPCRCGRVGCLETVASMAAMITAAHHAVPAITDEQSLIAAFKAGDESVRRIVLEAGADARRRHRRADQLAQCQPRAADRPRRAPRPGVARGGSPPGPVERAAAARSRHEDRAWRGAGRRRADRRVGAIDDRRARLEPRPVTP